MQPPPVRSRPPSRLVPARPGLAVGAVRGQSRGSPWSLAEAARRTDSAHPPGCSPSPQLGAALQPVARTVCEPLCPAWEVAVDSRWRCVDVQGRVSCGLFLCLCLIPCFSSSALRVESRPSPLGPASVGLCNLFIFLFSSGHVQCRLTWSSLCAQAGSGPVGDPPASASRALGPVCALAAGCLC